MRFRWAREYPMMLEFREAGLVSARLSIDFGALRLTRQACFDLRRPGPSECGRAEREQQGRGRKSARH